MQRSLALASLALGSMALAACSSSSTGGDAGCQPETDQAYCSRLGKNCDTLSAFDNCGASRSVDCGSCNGTCTDNLCQAASTSGGTSGGAAGTTSAGTSGSTTGGGTTGSTTGGGTTGEATGGTTGGTTGEGDAGCAATSCPGFGDIISAAFVPGLWSTHSDSTLDSIESENISLVIGLNTGTPLNGGDGEYSFSTNGVEVSVSGDSSQLIAADMVPSWETGAPALSAESGQLDFELLPTNQSGPFYTLELFCSGETPGAALSSVSCGSPSVTIRYFYGATLEDSITSTSVTMNVYAADAGS